MQKTVTIYGAGYVGLVTGACLAELGHFVLLIDVDAQKIAELSQGICPIYEPGLQDLLTRHIKTGRLTFDTDLIKGVQHGLFQFVAVGTPSSEDGSADLSYVFDVVKGIAQNLPAYRLMVIKSTVPVGTSQKISQTMTDILKHRGINIPFDMVSNPEFLKQGGAIEDFMSPDRIIIGASSDTAFKEMYELYAPLNDTGQRFISMDVTSAELTKYAANAYLATRISFINQMSQLAEALGANIDMVRRGIGSDNRIGARFLMAGCGFGGSCFPKDVRALIKMSEAVQTESRLLLATEAVNNHQKQILFKKISRYFAGDLKDKTIALWGLAFKPNTDDMREAPSRVLIEALLQAGAKIQAYDPAAMAQAKKIYSNQPNLIFCEDAMAALNNADVLAIVTEWDDFKYPNFKAIREKLRHPVIFDGRNMYDPLALAEHNFKYYGVGYGEVI